MYPDSCGIEFDEVRGLWLPERVRDWPQVQRVKDSAVCAIMHRLYCICWQCATEVSAFTYERNIIEAHHLAAGTKGRSDELTAIVMLCRYHHASVNTSEFPLGRLLWLKWKFDRVHLSWVRLTLLHRRWLPDLICTPGEIDDG